LEGGRSLGDALSHLGATSPDAYVGAPVAPGMGRVLQLLLLRPIVQARFVGPVFDEVDAEAEGRDAAGARVPLASSADAAACHSSLSAAPTLGWRCLLCAAVLLPISRCSGAELHVFCRRSTNNGMWWGCRGDVRDAGMLRMLEMRGCGWGCGWDVRDAWDIRPASPPAKQPIALTYWGIGFNNTESSRGGCPLT